MAGFQIHMTGQRQKSLSELAEIIHKQTQAEPVCRNTYQFGDTNALLLVLEDYYVRAGGYISLTVLLTDQAEKQTAEIVASGGGEGTSFSFGACRSFAKSCATVLEDCGFTDNDPETEKSLPKRILEYFVD